MKIAYRRMSGPIGFTPLETGTRGLWLEKRNALVLALEQRGHVVDFVNRMTKYSQLASEPAFGPKTHDWLLVEFGSSNRSFYGADLDRTIAMIRQHVGRVIFICDDPDLPFVWKEIDDDWSRWSAWFNATRGVPFGNQPDAIPIFDMPFSALQVAASKVAAPASTELVYIGRPGGRSKAIAVVTESGVPWVACAKAAEWKGFNVRVIDAPPQAERASFYREYRGCLALADAKHKRLGWRTGRAYHALAAGIPVIAERDHAALEWADTFADEDELRSLAAEWNDPRQRASAWQRQRRSVQRDLSRVLDVFVAHGL